MNADNLRPSSFGEFSGQVMAKNVLQTACAAARARNDVLSHVLLSGPAGTGKTTLAQILASEMRGNLKVVSGPALQRKHVCGLLRGLQRNDILFIDEIHALPRILEEWLYPAMESYILPLTFGSRTVRVPLNPFTLVGATTRVGSLSAPLRDRFGISLRMDSYSGAELAQIVARSARLLNVGIDGTAADEIARRSRGTPRIANSLLERCRDAAQLRGCNITFPIVVSTCNALGIDGNGLDSADRDILHILANSARPVGLQAISVSMNESERDIEVREAYLMRSGFLIRNSRGRLIQPLGRAALAQHT